MFPRPIRLTTTKDILHVYRQGQKRSTGPVTCTLLKGAQSRATVIVDTKVTKKASERNLLKRRARAFLQSRGLPKGDLIVRFYAGSPTLTYAELTRQIAQCLDRL